MPPHGFEGEQASPGVPRAEPPGPARAAGPSRGQGRAPTSLVVIGSIFIVVATLLILSGLMNVLVLPQMGEALDAMELELKKAPPEEIPWEFTFVLSMLRYAGIWMSVQMAIAVLALVAGIQFLRRRAWARTALEVVTWVGVAQVGLVGLSWLWMATGFSSKTGAGGPGLMIGVVLIVMFAVFAAPFVVILAFLRGRTIREAVARW